MEDGWSSGWILWSLSVCRGVTTLHPAMRSSQNALHSADSLGTD